MTVALERAEQDGGRLLEGEDQEGRAISAQLLGEQLAALLDFGGGDSVGASGRSRDFNGDSRDDLAASVPGENSSVADDGEVLTVMGSATGLDPSTAGGGRQGGFFAGADEAGDYLGGGIPSAAFW
jgi:hypothetical protein